MFSPSYSPYTISQLQFDEPVPKCGVSTCVLAAVCVVVAYFLFAPTRTPRYGPDMRYMPGSVTGMASRAMQAMQAVTAANDVDASEKYPECERGVSLIEAALDSKDAHVTAEEKAVCTQRLATKLAASKATMVMVFAPWCGHCHKMMPGFSKLVKGGVMVNGDCLTDEAMRMGKLSDTVTVANFKVEYYPLLGLYERATNTFSPHATLEALLDAHRAVSGQTPPTTAKYVRMDNAHRDLFLNGSSEDGFPDDGFSKHDPPNDLFFLEDSPSAKKNLFD